MYIVTRGVLDACALPSGREDDNRVEVATEVRRDVQS